MIAAVIFDLDGTVLDNEGIWEEVFLQVAKKNSIDLNLSKNKWIHEPGIGIEPNWKKLVSADEKLIKSLTAQTWHLYREQVGTKPPVREGMVELIEAIKERNWLTALATSSEWYTVEKELEDLNLYLAFDVTTTGDEVTALKPDPEMYLLTFQKLGVEPDECIIVEDSIAGLHAARDAGAIPVGIISGYATKENLQAAGAKLVVDNLNEVMVGLAEYGDAQTIQG